MQRLSKTYFQKPCCESVYIYGYENFKDNKYPNYNTKPVMLFCGDNNDAKSTVRHIIEALDWEPLDVEV